MYFLNLLFLKNESIEANKFMKKMYYDFKKYDGNFDKLLLYIVEYFKNDKKILIIFDNIYSKYQYSLINDMTDKINVVKNNHIFIREFIEINENTLDIIKKFFDDKTYVKTVGCCGQMKYDLKIITLFQEKKQDYLKDYKNYIDNSLSKIFKDYSVTKCTKLIKLFYYLYTDKISKDESNDLIISNILKDFIQFLYLKIYDFSVEIKFRNKIIENYFQSYYIFYYNIWNINIFLRLFLFLYCKNKIQKNREIKFVLFLKKSVINI